jgi:amino acid adenylation domain-containing protein
MLQELPQALCIGHTDHKKGLDDLLPTAFPAQPDESYRAQATERATAQIPITPVQGDTVSRSSILQLAWALVISAYTGANNAVFGLCIDRSSKVAASVRPIRVIIKPEDSVDETLKLLERFTDIDSPCQDECHAAKSASLSNVLVIRQSLCNTPSPEATTQLPGSISSAYPLLLTGEINYNGYNVCLDFDPEIISSTMAHMVLAQLVHVLGCVQSNRTRSLGSLLNLNPSGIEQVISWNSRLRLHKKDLCVHDVISRRCQATPAAPAVCAWDGDMDYSTLDKLSNYLASRLVSLIPVSEQFIGVLSERSMWTAVSILAVMKSGHAFFFLDPSLPDQRLKALCRISQAAMVLTSPEQIARARQLQPPVLVIQEECQGPIQPPASPLPTVSPHQAVYLAFTSGSSGEPKGVVIEHAATCSGVDLYATRVGLNHQSRVFQFASYSFVISILDHLVSLMKGACLCVASESQIQDSLSGTMRALEANWVEITPSVARVLDPESLPGLKTLLLTGESMIHSDLEKWYGKVNLKTCYGQSENSLGALVDNKTTSSSPTDLGFPFAANCWVVDSNDTNRLVPIGAEGELLLEGHSLARGYLHNEEQTRAAFIHNPAWLQEVRPGESGRFLRTGDIVRYRPEDGSLQYVGRNGTQVKLRGQRIELAEVEFQLKKQFLDADAVVADIVTTSQGNDVLVAFVTSTRDRMLGDSADEDHFFAPPSNEFTHQSQKVFSQLRDTLPNYMVPTHFVPLTRLPLTPSGKLNRRLLRNKASELGHELQKFHPLSKKSHRQPCTDSETTIQQICAEILSSDTTYLNMNSSFFEIGGNSITTIQLVTQARNAGFSFRPEQVFQQLSLATLAEHRGISVARDEEVVNMKCLPSIDALKEKLMQQSPATIDIQNVSDIYPCTQPQEWLFNTHEGGCFLLRFSGPLDVAQLQASCQRLVETHTTLRSLFVHLDEAVHQVILNRLEISFTIQTTASGKDPESVARDMCRVDYKRAFRLGVPPLQFTLVRGSGEQSVLIIRLSHAQYDGSCQGIILSDLCSLYQGQQRPVVLTNYGLYARKVALQQTPAAFKFWRDFLAGSAITRLPYNTQVTGLKNNSLHCSVEVTVGQPPKEITMATVVKAAWSKVLQEVTGGDDIVFAQLVSTRGIDVPGIDRTVGICFNQVPVRVQYRKCMTALDLLHAVQRQHTRALAFETTGWGTIVSDSTDWPAGSQPQSLVIFQNFPTKTHFQVSDDLKCELIDYIPIEPPHETLELYAEPEKDRLKLCLTGPSCLLEKAELQNLLDKLCVTLRQFTGSPEIALE